MIGWILWFAAWLAIGTFGMRYLLMRRARKRKERAAWVQFVMHQFMQQKYDEQRDHMRQVALYGHSFPGKMLRVPDYQPGKVWRINE